jgi:hypothetical protein
MIQERLGSKKVFIETRVSHGLAREDNIKLDISLERYDSDLLHFKNQATSNVKGWSGPAEIDDAQIDYLAQRVAFLISDDVPYSTAIE